MKHLKITFLSAIIAIVFAGVSVAQPPTTAKTFRMMNDATHSVSITASAAAGTGTFTWPQPAVGIFHSDGSGNMTLGAVDLSGPDVFNTLTINKGGTGITTVGPANSVAYSNGTTFAFTAAPPAIVTSFLVSIAGAAPTYSTTLPPGSVPFNIITNGTNTGNNALTVGNGSILSPTGTGVITANKFVGPGSTSDAVDLQTTEVNGILTVPNGGTGTNSVGLTGAVAYSNGSNYAFTTVGTAGQILQSNGGGAPTWINPSAINAPRAVGRTAIGAVQTLTINSGVAVAAGTVITVTIETTGNADPNGTYTFGITNKTGTSFDIVFPFTLIAGDFANWAVY